MSTSTNDLSALADLKAGSLPAPCTVAPKKAPFRSTRAVLLALLVLFLAAWLAMSVFARDGRVFELVSTGTSRLSSIRG